MGPWVFAILIWGVQERPTESRVRELVEQLSSDDAVERQRATDQLVQLGEAFLTLLPKVMPADPEPKVRDRLAQIRHRIERAARFRRLAQKVSRPIGEDRDLMTKLLSTEPEEVMKGLGLLTGHVATRDSMGFVLIQHGRTVDPTAAELAAILAEVLAQATPTDQDWCAVHVVALRTIQEFRLSELAPETRRLLASPEFMVRKSAVYALSEIALATPSESRRSLIDALDPLLKDENPEVRAGAVEAISRIAGPERLFGLTRLSKDPDARVRLKVVDAVLSWEDRKYVDVILELARDADPQVRRAAVQGIGALRDSSRLGELIPRLNDDDGYVRLEMLNTLAMVRAKEHAGDVVPLLRDPCTFVRSRALELLEIFEAAEYAGEIAKLLNDNEFETIRLRALRVLAHFGKPESAPAVARSLRDDNAVVRQVALETLGSVGGREQISDVLPVLKDESIGLRLMAAELLLKWGDRSHLDPLHSLLEVNDATVQIGAACALVQAGDAKGVDHLLHAIADGEGYTRARALVVINAVAAPKLWNRFCEATLKELSFGNADVTEFFAEVEKQTGIRIQTSMSGGKRFDVPFGPASRTAGALLQYLGENSDGLFALVFDDDAGIVRVVDVDEAARYWKKRYAR